MHVCLDAISAAMLFSKLSPSLSKDIQIFIYGLGEKGELRDRSFTYPTPPSFFLAFVLLNSCHFSHDLSKNEYI